MVRLLLDAGAKPNVVTSYNKSPLGTALHFSDFTTMRILIDAGADLSILNWNPLMVALVFSTLDEVRSELEHGADVNEDRRYGMTPWALCLLVGDVSKAELLLNYGAVVAPDNLFMAVGKDNPSMVAWLLEHGRRSECQRRLSALGFARGRRSGVRLLACAS